MNTRWFKACALAISAFTVIANVQAQTKPKPAGNRTSTARPASGYSSGYSSGYGAPAAAKRDTTKKKETNTTKPQSGYSSGYGSPAGATSGGSTFNSNVPTEVVKGSGSGIGDSIAPSLRN